MKSPVRYVGGKSWLVKQLVAEIITADPARYVEPFLGGGAIALNVPSYIPKILSDSNTTLIDMWRCIREAPTALIAELRRLELSYSHDQTGYLHAREQLNTMIHVQRPMWITRAAHFLYINARCFNGLWRVNGKGYYNVPWGKIERPSSIDLGEARELSTQLKNAQLHAGDYWHVLTKFVRLDGAAIYCDPPYDATFDSYTADAFGETAQRELAERLRWCAGQGARVWASNKDTDLIREIYSWAKIETVDEMHVVGSTGERRGMRGCVLIRS